MNSSIKAQNALLCTLQEIQDRAAVEECMRDMLIDVELSIQLQERLHTRHQIQTLQQRIQEQDHILLETRAIRNETTKQQVSMADALFSELLSLSEELGTLKEIKQQHEELLVQYDELVAKLMQAEDNVQDEREKRNRDTSSAESNKPSDAIHSERLESPIATHQEGVDLVDISKNLVKATDHSLHLAPTKEVGDNNSEENVLLDEPPPIQRQGTALDIVQKVQASKEETQRTESLDETETDVAVVTLDDEVESTVLTVPHLDQFDVEILMKIFSYLDALDILNTAQINVSMYSRVDSFFGFGTDDTEEQHVTVEDSTSPSEQASSPIPTTITTETISAPTLVQEQPTPGLPVASTNAFIHQPTVVALPPISSKTSASVSAIAAPANTESVVAATITSPKHVPSKSNDSAILNRGIFSLLQPRRPAAATNSAVVSSTSISAQTVAALSPVPSPSRIFLRTSMDATLNSTTATSMTLNSAMANSMAAKLSDAELNAILLMTDRLKQKEIVADKLTKENETLVAKLDGTEGVKQFLINKVRDMEVSLTSILQNEMKVAQQIASDQEVIAFLDGRVQELERNAQLIENEKQRANDALDRVQKQSIQKATVMEDMLQFEREKLSDQEREWKMTKKLLVKEVKNCRAQIIALQAERDGYREQNETLRRAIVNNNSNATSSNGTMHHHPRDRTFA
jgi:hypothetical protein